MPYQPAFRANASTSSYGQYWQTVVYNNFVVQRGSHYNSSTSTFTAPVAGWYAFFASWTAVNNSDLDGTLAICVNGSTSDLIDSTSFSNTGANYDAHKVSGCGYLSANDTVTIKRYSSISSNTVTRTSNYYGGWFSGYLIG